MRSMKRPLENSTGIVRLDEMIDVAIKAAVPMGLYLLDCYMGKKVRSEYSHAITTRTATDDNTFVMEVEDKE